MNETCNCKEFADLELRRTDISSRIMQTRNLRKLFRLVAGHRNDEHKLYVCDKCQQMWQASRAWNWGNEMYMFRVPRISVEEWMEEPFVQPDEMLIFSAALEMLGPLRVQQVQSCRSNNCHEHAIDHSAFCVKHHVESLQKIHKFPAYPSGRSFLPYYGVKLE